MTSRVVVLNIVGLAPAHLAHMPNLAALAQRGTVRPLRPSFPAVTCSMQATLLTGTPPREHGIIANGYFDRQTCEVKFWEQPAALVERPRLWDQLPRKKTAVLFWQNSMFIQADTVVTPRPLHLEHKFIQWCYSKPAGYYEELCRHIGGFKLQHYWGPLAGLQSSQWIARAAALTWRMRQPDLMLVYLPHLDYASQKVGPTVPAEMRAIDAVVGELLASLDDHPIVVVCSEYSLSPVDGVIYPNRLLRNAGLLRVREIVGQEFLDCELSRAFAMVDHQVAHLYCQPHAIAAARATLAAAGCQFTTIEHPRAGELVAIAPRGKWFAYYWWDDPRRAPAFAHTVDIHRKPGYDPCELWADWGRTLRTLHPATVIAPERVRGSHGRVGDDGEGWGALILDERAAAMVKLEPTVDATEFAPLVRRLLDT